MDRRRILKSLAGLAACPLCANPVLAQTAHWNYQDTSHWGGTCAVGGQQSPIDIGSTKSAALPQLALAWGNAAHQIVNNGHTIQVNLPPGGTLTAGNLARMPLIQFHFHHPSEHTVGGARSRMEVHFVHIQESRIAVVGVLMQAGGSNATFKRIVTAMPKTAQLPPVDASTIDPNGLLPGRLGYYRYSGSLTTPTPDCKEGVEWMVLTDSIAVEEVDIRAFAALYPLNARPARKDDRVVQRSQ